MAAILSRPQCVKAEWHIYIGLDNGLSPIQNQAISETMRTHSYLEPWEQIKAKFEQSTTISIQENGFDNVVVCKMSAILSQPQCVNKNACHFADDTLK